MIELSRRSFLGGLTAGMIAAPAIVRAASLMPVRASILPLPDLMPYAPTIFGTWMDYSGTFSVPVIRHAFVPRLRVQAYVTPLPLDWLLEGNGDE